MCHMYVDISGMYVQRWNICYISICGFGKGPIVYSTQRGGGGGEEEEFGGGYNFLRGLILGGGNFENAQNVREVKIRKSCQTILWLKQIHVSFKSRQKNMLWQFFVSNKMLPV